MDFSTAIRTCLTRYATFSGRAPRSEYWWFVLFCILGSMVAGTIESVGTIFALATVLPSISVGIRRLHDVGRSGWWWWLWMIPLIGWIVLMWWAVKRGETESNIYGPDPLGARAYGPSPIPRVPRQ